jgi:hypothetical protein
MKRVLKWLGAGVAVLVVVAGLLCATRSDPIGLVPGRELSGELVLEPVRDWSFTDEHRTIAVETRPAMPHSVTTICFAVDGALYVPASRAAEKSWPHFAVSDPRVRVKVGDKIYPGVARRVEDAELRPKLMAAASEKYDFEPPEDPAALNAVWVFRIDSAQPGVAAGPM